MPRKSTCTLPTSKRQFLRRGNELDEGRLDSRRARRRVNLARLRPVSDQLVAIQRHPLFRVFVTMLFQPLQFARQINRRHPPDLWPWWFRLCCGKDAGLRQLIDDLLFPPEE